MQVFGRFLCVVDGMLEKQGAAGEHGKQGKERCMLTGPLIQMPVLIARDVNCFLYHFEQYFSKVKSFLMKSCEAERSSCECEHLFSLGHFILKQNNKIILNIFYDNE